MGLFSRFRTGKVSQQEKSLRPPGGRRNGLPSLVMEPFTGAWQRNKEINAADLGSFFAIYSCVTLIAGDISKLRARVMALGSDGIQVEQDTPTALRRPNRYQNHIQFKQWWLTSKLSHGNAYGLKQRDRSGRVEAIYILDPRRVRPLVATDGAVYYELSADELNGIEEVAITVPASEIIHDRYQPQHHPLIGVTPIAAAALSGKLGLRIQQDSQNFFSNGARPSGILVAPGAISSENAARLKTDWATKFSGENSGKVAVLGDGIKFEPMRSTSVDSQLVEQLKLSAEVVCSCFHVPPFKIGFGTLPSGKVEEMNLIYYSDCLQVLVEEFEQCMTDGLSLSDNHSVELDVDALWRMDTESKLRMLTEATKGVMAPNEARKRVNLRPVEGGDSVYMQQQNFSLEALARRDAQPDPFDTDPAAKAQLEGQADAADQGSIQQEALNGAQVAALQGIVFAVSDGSLSIETASALIRVAFPLVTDEQIDEIMSGAVAIPAVDEQPETNKSIEGELFMLKTLNATREALYD